MRDNNKKKYLIVSIIVGLFVFIMCSVFFFAKKNLSKTDNEVLEKEETQIEEQIDEPEEEENKYITNVDPSELKNKEKAKSTGIYRYRWRNGKFDTLHFAFA